MNKETNRKSAILNLKNELIKFGLNPMEWRISRQRSKSFRVESKSDRHFAFIGKVRQKGTDLKWQTLELVSL